MIGRVVRWVAGLLVALIVGIAIAFVVVTSALSYGWQRAWLTEQIEIAATEALGRPVLINSIEGVLHREFKLAGVEVGGAESPLVMIDELGARIESLALWAGPTLTLKEVRISGVALDIRQAEEGSWSWQNGAAPAEEEPPGEPSSGFRLRIRSLELREARALVRPQNQAAVVLAFDGDVEGMELGASTEVEQLVASFEAYAEDAAESSRIGGRLAASYLEGEWLLAALEAENDQVSLSAKGAGDGERIQEARVTAEIASLNALAETLGAADLALDGSLELTADFSGPYEWPLGTLSAQGVGLKSGETEIGDMRLRVHTTGPGRLELDALSLKHEGVEFVAGAGAVFSIVNDLIKIENFTLRRRRGPGAIRLAATLPKGPASATGSAARSVMEVLLHDARTRLELVSSEFRLETFQPFLSLWGLEAEGKLDSELRVRGASSGPRIAGFVKLESSRFVMDAAKVEGLDVNVDMSGTLEKPVAAISGSASLLALERATIHGLDLKMDLSGTRAIPTASISGSARRLTASDREWGVVSVLAQLEGNEATINRLTIEEGPLVLSVGPGSRVAWSGEQLRFEEFSVEEGSQRLFLRGSVSRDRADALQIELRSIEPSRIFERLHAFGLIEEDQEIGGIVNGELFLSGPRDQPNLRANFEWSEPQLDEFSFDAIRLSVETEEALILASTDWVRKARTVATVHASLPRGQVFIEPEALLRNPETRLQAELAGFELGSLSPFMPPAISSLRGKLTVNLDSHGAPGRPALAGSLVVEEGGLKLKALGGQAFAPISVRAELRDGAVEIREMRIGEGEQRIDGQATILLDGMSPSEIDSRLTFRSFPLDAPGLVKGTLSGPLMLKGKPKALDLTGSLEIAGLLVRIPDPGDATLKEIRIVSTDTEAPPKFQEEGDAQSLLDPLRVSVDVKLAKNSWARGRGAEIELRGEMNAAKERGGELRLSGSVNTVRGTYEVYGRRFRIESGEVVLDGGSEVDPVINIRALHRVRGVKIYAILEGRMSEPRLRFESDPELDENDIASYLILGRPASGSAGEDELALQAVAAQVAVGAAVREFEKVFGGVLPVDVIDIRMDDGGEERELRAGVGKYIGDRLFLHYERGFGDEPDDELKAEWELTPIWSLESTVSSNGDTAGDLVLEIEY